VEEQNTPGKQLFCHLPLDGGPLQKGVCEDPAAQALRIGFRVQRLLLKQEILPGDGDVKIRRIV
jgi:hypothetical protein